MSRSRSGPRRSSPTGACSSNGQAYTGPTQVEWTFQAIPDGTTFVRVSESGWEDDADKLVRYVADSTQGFTLLLAGMKAFLEHGIRLNLTLDRYPEGIEEQVIGE